MKIIHLDDRLAYIPFYSLPGWEEHVKNMVGFMPNHLSPQQEAECFKSFSPGKIDIENWDGKNGNWKRFSMRSIENGLRREIQFAGVYIIQKRTQGRIENLYIGSSFNLHKRLSNQHEKIKRLRNYQNICICIRKNKKRNEHLSLEASLIRRLKPEWNGRAK